MNSSNIMVANIIHSPKQELRLESIKEECAKQGFGYNLWPAVFAETFEKGTCQAHKQIIRWAKKTKQPSVLIMEDDIGFTAPGAFNYFMDNCPPDFDLYLGGIYFGKIHPSGRVYQFSGTHCYICHSRFYDTMLSLPEKDHIDVELSRLPGVYMVCDPFVAIQKAGWSDNQNKMVDFSDHLKNRRLFTGKPS